MEIVFLTHPAFTVSQSMPRYAEWLAEGMRKRQHIVAVWRPERMLSGVITVSALQKWLGYVDQYIIFPLLLKRRIKKAKDCTLFVITDHALGPWVPLVKRRNHVIHCHDFLAQKSAAGLYPQNLTKTSGQMYQRLIRKGYRQGLNFISISKKTQVDLHSYLTTKPNRSTVIYNGLNRQFSPSDNILELRKQLSIDLRLPLEQGYLLHVGGNQWYKNRLGVLKLYLTWREISTTTLPLLMIGPNPTYEMSELRNNSPFKNDIFFKSGQSDETVSRAYAGAVVFLFPSLAEGFGWPIAEAMASGVPVITTNDAPMNEVGNDAVLYLDVMPPANVSEWEARGAALINDVINWSDGQRKEFVHKGLNQVKKFESDYALDMIEGFYKNIIAS